MSTKPWISPEIEDIEDEIHEVAQGVIRTQREEGITPEKTSMFLSGALWMALNGGDAVDEDEAADEAQSVLDNAFGSDPVPTTLESMFFSGALWQKLIADANN